MYWVYHWMLAVNFVLFFLGSFVGKWQKKNNLLISLPKLFTCLGSEFLRTLLWEKLNFGLIPFMYMSYGFISAPLLLNKKSTETAVLVIARIFASTLIQNRDYGILKLVGFNMILVLVFDMIIASMSNLFTFYGLKLLGYEVKPVVIVSKGLSVNSHWIVSIENRTFELFKSRSSKGNTQIETTEDQTTKESSENLKRRRNKGEKNEQEEEDQFEVTPQQHGRSGRDGYRLREMFYIPFYQRGIVGIYFGNNLNLQKQYLDTYKELSKEKYKLFFNDCQVFCHEFVRKIGPTFQSTDYRKSIFFVIAITISGVFRSTSFWGEYVCKFMNFSGGCVV